MSQFKDKSLDELYREIEGTRARLDLAESHMRELGEPIEKISLSITGATLEINAVLKQLFLCAQADLQEYEILQVTLMQHLNNIAHIAKTKFGTIKKFVPSENNQASSATVN